MLSLPTRCDALRQCKVVVFAYLRLVRNSSLDHVDLVDLGAQCDIERGFCQCTSIRPSRYDGSSDARPSTPDAALNGPATPSTETNLAQ